MKENIRAALISGFGFPGLGQISRGRRRKGGILAVLSVILLLIFAVVSALVFCDYFLLALQFHVQWDGSVFVGCLQKREVALLLPGGALMFVWIYSVIDALMDTDKRNSAGQGSGN